MDPDVAMRADRATENVEGVRNDLGSLLGDYARVIGVVDNLIDERLRGFGAELGPALSARVLDRVRDEDRFRLLRALLGDIESEAPRDSIDTVLRAAKRIRDEVAHVAHWMVVDDESGEVGIDLIRPISRLEPAPVRITWRDLAEHRRRLRWATDWLQWVTLTEPTFATEQERASASAVRSKRPSLRPPSIPRPAGAVRPKVGA